MDRIKPLREDRQHGDLLFPMSAYEMKIEEDQAPLPYHWHPEIEIFCISAGRACFQVEGKQFPMKKGDVLLIRPNALHGSHDCLGGPLEFRAVVFDYAFLAGMGNDRIEQEYLRPFLLGEEDSYLLFTGREELAASLNRIFMEFSEKEKGYELLMRAFLLEMIHEMVRTQGKILPAQADEGKSRMIRSIVAYVEENYGQKLTLSGLARSLAVSEGYLCRFFRVNFRMTFVEYVQRVRLQKAQRLLLETDEPVGKIALDVGFGSGSYFTTEFGKYYHATPRAFRGRKGL